MPRFLGLFSRKSKRINNSPSACPPDDHSSLSVSPTAATSLADKSVPSTKSSVYPSIANSPSATSTASSSKLRLPFSRKRHSPPNAAGTSTTSVNTTESHSVAHRELNPAPLPSFGDRERNSVASDGELPDLRRLRPPPSKSAIFAAYADPSSALSTRSLPGEVPQPLSLQDPIEPSSLPDNPQHSEAPSPPVSSKKPFFSWAKVASPAPVAKTKSKPTSRSQPVRDPMTQTAVDLTHSSFNLKSFRHVGPSSPPDSQVSLAVPSSSPLPRPRGQSVGDSSQRISVAAFREAQARRSTAGSPVPSLRSASPFGTPQEQGGPASPRLSMLRSSTSHDTRLDGGKNRGGSASDSDAEASASGDDSDDESDNECTLTQRNGWNGKVKAKSEMGHSSSKAANTETSPDNNTSRLKPTLGQNVNYHRQRASMSTSAATPSAAARMASILVNAGDSSAEYKRNLRHIREASVYSNPGASMASNTSPNPPHRSMSPSDSSEEDDDAPLATLVPPKRPGSSLSNVSGSSAAARNRSNSNVPATRGKPLIDINELIGGKSPGLTGKREDLAEEKGFTKGNTLLAASANASPSMSSSTKSPSLIKTSCLSTSPPPLSPTESITSSGFATAPSSIKATSFGQSSSSNSNSEQVVFKRDGLSERLLRVAKGTSTAGAAVQAGPFSSPLGTPDVNPLPTTDDTKRSPFPRTTISPRSSFSASAHPAESMDSKISVRGYQPSPPDEELLNILGASVKLISRTGDSSPSEVDIRNGVESEDETDEDESSDDDDDKNVRRNASASPKGSEKGTDEWEKVDPREVKGKEEYKSKDGILKAKSVLNLGKEKGKDRERSEPVQELAPKVSEPAIAPIPIKQRTPTPSFSVTSRPPLAKGVLATSTSGSGTTSVAPSTTASSGSFTSSSSNSGKTRQRCSTLLNPLDTRDSSSSTTSATGSIQVRGRAPGPVAPILRAPAMSRGSGISDQAVKDTGSNTTLNRSSMGDSSNGARQRSGNMMPAVSISPVPTMPMRPFARRDSPASSTGDSSSGRAPLTPRDGSDIGSAGDSGVGVRTKGVKSGSAMKGSSGLMSAKRRSVCFEDDLIDDSAPPSPTGKGRTHQKKDSKEGVDEEKRKERRRSEARAAIELGNVINGRRPIVDDEDEDMPINQSMQGRMPSMNPMMGMGNGVHPMQMGSMPGWNGPWGNTMGQQMLNASQYMVPQVPDPGLLAAHQQAMMIAKQAYQMAVAQQAAAAAGDEWERGSVVSGFGGGSMFGGRMPTAPMGSPYGMGGMGGMSMGMNMNMNMMSMGGNWSSAGSTVFPPSSRSMFGGINTTRSEYAGGGGGGSGGGGGWNSARSTYGESFGPPTGRVPKPGMSDRDWREPGHMPPVPPVPLQQTSSSGRTSARTRTTSQPSSVKSAGQRKPAPPSSWKGS